VEAIGHASGLFALSGSETTDGRRCGTGGRRVVRSAPHRDGAGPPSTRRIF